MAIPQWQAPRVPPMGTLPVDPQLWGVGNPLEVVLGHQLQKRGPGCGLPDLNPASWECAKLPRLTF